MGKIVKYCGSCDEGFAEKFGFCPNCGQTLQAFEMNPVGDTRPIPQAAPAPAENFVEEPRKEPVIEAGTTESNQVDEPILELADQADHEEPATTPVAAAAPFVTQQLDADAVRPEYQSTQYARREDFHVHVIEEKNVGTRRAYMLGSFAFMAMVLLGGLVYNLFSKDLEVGSINDDIFSAVLVEDVPAVVEEEVQPKNKEKGGGGGGGGREEEEEVTQGDLADQSPKPTRPPDAKVFRSDNFELKMPPPETQGNRQLNQRQFDRWGDPNGRFSSFSNGTGSGGGQGSGVGTGQGSGRGTGAGSGIGSGTGSGLGNGNGDGRGNGDGDGLDRVGPPPTVRAGVTAPLKIISKPRPGYTDAARQNNIQGTVILRVTFLASGQIGSISPVKGLPNGLTEQAIAAARRISFEPAKVNGVGQSVTRQIEYSFSIY
jgi:TonB family protein